jgi:hypothetical protein
MAKLINESNPKNSDLSYKTGKFIDMGSGIEKPVEIITEREEIRKLRNSKTPLMLDE